MVTKCNWKFYFRDSKFTLKIVDTKYRTRPYGARYLEVTRIQRYNGIRSISYWIVAKMCQSPKEKPAFGDIRYSKVYTKMYGYVYRLYIVNDLLVAWNKRTKWTKRVDRIIRNDERKKPRTARTAAVRHGCPVYHSGNPSVNYLDFAQDFGNGRAGRTWTTDNATASVRVEGTTRVYQRRWIYSNVTYA